MNNKTRLNKTRQEFLLTFFDDFNKYQFKEVNGFILEKQINGETGNPQVAIWKKDVWDKVKTLYGERELQKQHLKNI